MELFWRDRIDICYNGRNLSLHSRVELAVSWKDSSQQIFYKTAKAASASVLCDTHGIVFINYTGKRQTINSDHEEIANKRPHMKKKEVLFHQQNVLYHRLLKTMEKIQELHFELCWNDFTGNYVDEWSQKLSIYWLSYWICSRCLIKNVIFWNILKLRRAQYNNQNYVAHHTTKCSEKWMFGQKCLPKITWNLQPT